MKRVFPLLLAGVLAVGCDRTGPGAPRASHVVHVRVDDGPETALPLRFDREELSLGEVLPRGTPEIAEWQEVVAEDATGAGRFTVHHPARRTDEIDLVLRSEEGQLRFEMVSKLPEGSSAHALRRLGGLTGVHAIRIRTEHAPPPPEGPVERAMPQVAVDGKPVRLAPARLDDLETIPIGGGRRHGWSLRDVLELAAPGRTVSGVALRASNGEERTLSAADLAGDDVLAVRFNRRGRMRYHRVPAGAREDSEWLSRVEEIRIVTGSAPEGARSLPPR